MKINIKSLEKLIKQGESHTLEFKKTTGQLSSTFETVCAFLNGEGGTVLIGITNKGQVLGQNVTDNTRQELAKELNKIEPSAQAQVNIQYLPVKEDKHVIAIQVTAGNYVPYAYESRAFYRNQSTTSRMSQHHYEQLLIKRGQLNHSWEEFWAVGYDINSLDYDEISRTIRDGVNANRLPPAAIKDTVEQALIRLKLLDQGKITNAAVILFAKEVFPAYAQCMLKMGRFIGTNITGNFMDNQQIYGNIFKILAEADYFIRRHLPIASFFQTHQFERIDKPALPVLAVREAMINAVCHRDYSVRSASISLAIFDDRLEIWNNGSLPSQLKIDDLKKIHGSFPRNKLIANVLYVREYFEKWGSGTNKMIADCRAENVPEPEFSEYSTGIAVTFRFKESIGTRAVAVKQSSLNLRHKTILGILAKSPEGISIQQIMAGLSNPPSQRMLQKDLKFLKEQELILVKGSGRSSVWALKDE
jgi:ATP-dependent DNA helicase RecG